MNSILRRSILVALCVAPSAALAENARFSCTATGADQCVYSVCQSNGGTRNFRLNAGESDDLPQMDIGRDTYCQERNDLPRRCDCKPVKANNSD